MSQSTTRPPVVTRPGGPEELEVHGSTTPVPGPVEALPAAPAPALHVIADDQREST